MTISELAEAAVVPVADDLKGTVPDVYVSLQPSVQASKDLEKAIVLAIETEIGKIARPKNVWIVPDMPKTRSGKIMRRILRKIAANEADQLGDISTLADPSVVENLMSSYVEMFSGKK